MPDEIIPIAEPEIVDAGGGDGPDSKPKGKAGDLLTKLKKVPVWVWVVVAGVILGLLAFASRRSTGEAVVEADYPSVGTTKRDDVADIIDYVPGDEPPAQVIPEPAPAPFDETPAIPEPAPAQAQASKKAATTKKKAGSKVAARKTNTLTKRSSIKPAAKKKAAAPARQVAKKPAKKPIAAPRSAAPSKGSTITPRKAAPAKKPVSKAIRRAK